MDAMKRAAWRRIAESQDGPPILKMPRGELNELIEELNRFVDVPTTPCQHPLHPAAQELPPVVNVERAHLLELMDEIDLMVQVREAIQEGEHNANTEPPS